MDPFHGIVFDPPSLHRYRYADGDPANKKDPSGRLSTLTETTASMGPALALAAIAILAAAAVTYVLLEPGVTPLKNFDIDTYKNFNTRSRRRDSYDGHELLQNAWLIVHGYTRVRGQGVASAENPCIAVTKAVHALINTMQRDLGLYDDAVLLNMTGETNIGINGVIAERAGVWPAVVWTAEEMSLMHLGRIEEMRERGIQTW
jgi:hypothetical protein